MDQPGRKSLDSLSIVPVLPGDRPGPPDSLTDVQAAIWREIVATKAPDWWKADNFPLLVAYCKAIDQHLQLAQTLETLDPITDLKQYKPVNEMLDKKAILIANLAVKMRLTQQSRYTPQAAATSDRKTASETRKPWEKSA